MTSDQSSLEHALNALAEQRDFQADVRSIVRGRFARDGDDPSYQARRRYTEGLRRFLYDRRALERILAAPELKQLFFRTFGYRGETNFTLYPDCWIRDLPLLDIGAGAYLADGIVLGTNQVSVCQRYVTVDSIRIGRRVVCDQQVMIGYGSRVGDDCVLGVRCLVGMKVRIDAGSVLSPVVKVGHHCRIGARVRVGNDAFIGSFSVIDDDVEVPDYERVPQFTHVTTRGQVPRRRR